MKLDRHDQAVYFGRTDLSASVGVPIPPPRIGGARDICRPPPFERVDRKDRVSLGLAAAMLALLAWGLPNE